MRGIDDDLEVVVEFLADVPAQFGGNNSIGIGVEATDAEIDFMFAVKNPDLGFLGRRLAFKGFSLEKVVDGWGHLPERIIERAVQARCMVDTSRLGGAKGFRHAGSSWFAGRVRLILGAKRNRRSPSQEGQSDTPSDSILISRKERHSTAPWGRNHDYVPLGSRACYRIIAFRPYLVRRGRRGNRWQAFPPDLVPSNAGKL